jgi:GINS complex subunit 4
MDDTAGGISMVDSPDLETAVFIRVLRDTLVLGRGRDVDDQMEAVAGEVVVARWADVKPLVESGDAELV